MAEILGETGVLQPLLRIAIRIGSRHVDCWTNEAGDVGDGLLEVVVVVGVAVRPLANLAQGVGVVGAAIEVAIPVRRVGADRRRHLQAVLGEVKLANHLRSQEAHEVGGDRELVARHGRLGEGGATQNGAALEDDDLQSGLREVRRGSEAVMPTTHNDRVVPFCHCSSQSRPESLGCGCGQWYRLGR